MLLPVTPLGAAPGYSPYSSDSAMAGNAWLVDLEDLAEQGLLAAHAEADRARLTNLVWTAKEAAAKVRREGLRLDVRRAVVAPAGAGAADGAWRALRVEWDDGAAPTAGWWRAEPGWARRERANRYGHF